jgi:hypothetical protein
MPAGGQALHLAGALARPLAGARWPKLGPFARHRPQLWRLLCAFSSCSRADANSRARASPRRRSWSTACRCSATEAWATCKALSASVRASVITVMRAVKASTTFWTDASWRARTSPRWRCRSPTCWCSMAKAWAVCTAPSADLAAALRVSSSHGPMPIHRRGHRLVGAPGRLPVALGDRGLCGLQGSFSFSARIGHHRNASRQSCNFIFRNHGQLLGRAEPF